MSIGSSQRNWWGKGGRIATFFTGRGRFVRLAPAESNSLLGADDDDSGSYVQIYKDYSEDFEDIRERNSELQQKLDELRSTIGELKTKNEARDKMESERMERANETLTINIGKTTDRIAVLEGNFVNKMKSMEKLSEIEKINYALEEQIKRLKDRLIYLEVNSIQHTPVESPSSAPQTNDLNQMEEMESLSSYDELYAWIIVLIFCVSFLIGMHI